MEICETPTDSLEFITMPPELRKTTCDLDNLEFDGRCKYGYKSYKVIPKGASFIVNREYAQIKGKPETRSICKEVIFYASSNIGKVKLRGIKEVPNEMFTRLIENSEIRNDTLAIFTQKYADWIKAVEFAKTAVDMQLLTEKDVEIIIDKIMEKEE